MLRILPVLLLSITLVGCGGVRTLGQDRDEKIRQGMTPTEVQAVFGEMTHTELRADGVIRHHYRATSDSVWSFQLSTVHPHWVDFKDGQAINWH